MNIEISSLIQEIKHLQDFKVKIENEYPKKFKQMDVEIEKEKDIQEKIERGEDVSEHLKKL